MTLRPILITAAKPPFNVRSIKINTLGKSTIPSHTLFHPIIWGVHYSLVAKSTTPQLLRTLPIKVKMSGPDRLSRELFLWIHLLTIKNLISGLLREFNSSEKWQPPQLLRPPNYWISFRHVPPPQLYGPHNFWVKWSKILGKNTKNINPTLPTKIPHIHNNTGRLLGKKTNYLCSRYSEKVVQLGYREILLNTANLIEISRYRKFICTTFFKDLYFLSGVRKLQEPFFFCLI